MDRRKFLKRGGLVGLSSAVAGGLIYPFLEAKWCRVTRRTIRLPNLPRQFSGMTVAVLADIHHGPFVPMAYVQHIVAMTNALKPDIIVLVGDYVHRHAVYISPAISELGRLKAPRGRFAIRGNHDNRNYYGAEDFRSLSCMALAEAKIPDLTNGGVWVEYKRARLRLCGVGDLWTDRQDLDSCSGRCNRARCGVAVIAQPRLCRAGY